MKAESSLEHGEFYFIYYGGSYAVMLIYPSCSLGSSYAQTLETSTFLGENVFCIIICILGLVLSAQLIGNMQVEYAIISI